MIVKVCGITNFEDACCALDAGADMLGFIFYPASPRSVRVDTARDIINELRKRTIHGEALSATHFVGVFVNESVTTMRQVLTDARLDFAQMSGDESLDVLIQMKSRGFKVVRNASEAHRYSHAVERAIGFDHPEMLPDLLLEADHPTLYGGTGQRAEVTVARDIARAHRMMLAGGLTPDNIAEAILAAHPWGVDVASGVEARKGKKDAAKVREFVKKAKNTDNRLQTTDYR